MTSPKRKRRSTPRAASPVKSFQSELRELRGELRATIRAYSARLEIQLAESLAAAEKLAAPEELPRERIHQLRDLTTMVRKRKLKPEKGRRKDLRKLDELISEVHLFLPDRPVT